MRGVGYWGDLESLDEDDDSHVGECEQNTVLGELVHTLENDHVTER